MSEECGSLGKVTAILSLTTPPWPLVPYLWSRSCRLGSAGATAAPLVAMFRPFQADSTETLWCLLCCVILELCRRARLTDGETVPTGRLPASEGGGFPYRAAREEAIPPTPSETSAAVPEEITNALDADLTALESDTDVLSGFEPMYNPFLIGRLMKRSWKLFPGTAPAAIAGPDRPDHRLGKSA